MDDVQLLPLIAWAPAHQLAATEIADGNHKPRPCDFDVEPQALGSVKLLRTVDGEAEGDPR
jgi:hypothetical protein